MFSLVKMIDPIETLQRKREKNLGSCYGWRREGAPSSD